MLNRIALALSMLGLAACHEGPTEAFLRPSGPPPSELPVTLRILPTSATSFVGPEIIAEGDSLVVAAEYEVSGCFNYTAAAGASGGAVVVTIVETAPLTARYCTMDIKSAIFRTVVRPAPRGRYPVVLRQRLEWMTDGPVERERARGSVTLP